MLGGHDGKTAVKVTLGKYLESPNQGTFTRRTNPLNAIAVSATRTWTDRNGDFFPQLDELGPNLEHQLWQHRPHHRRGR